MPYRSYSRPLLAAALVGFCAGAFAMSLVVWHFGNVVGSEADSRAWPLHLDAVVDRWGSGDWLMGERVGVSVRSMAIRSRTRPAGEPRIGPGDEVLGDGDLLVPVLGVHRDELRPSFSDPRGASRRHEAIDILAARHTPVLAAQDGTIARLYRSRLGGITVYQFDPTGEYVYYYAHLERYAEGLQEGNPVRRGDVLGYVGTTGNAPPDTPHLHFAIYRASGEGRWSGGEPLDPYALLTSKQAVRAGTPETGP